MLLKILKIDTNKITCDSIITTVTTNTFLRTLYSLKIFVQEEWEYKVRGSWYVSTYRRQVSL